MIGVIRRRQRIQNNGKKAKPKSEFTGLSLITSITVFNTSIHLKCREITFIVLLNGKTMLLISTISNSIFVVELLK